MSTPADRSTELHRAKAIRIENELARRGIVLNREAHELVGPCPVCGGTDRFAINIPKQVWNCRGCGKGGDVIAFVMHIDGSDFRTAIETLTGTDRPTAATTRAGEKPKSLCLKPLHKWWGEARPIVGTLAEKYLANRGIAQFPPDVNEVLRFHPEAIFGKIESTWRFVPCLLALVRDIVSNEAIGLQRVGLTKDAEKIDRMAIGRVRGGAVKFWNDAEVTAGVVIAEGIETALAASTIEWNGTLLQPMWATVFADNMKRFPVLPGIQALTLVVDNDAPDKRGQEAAAACAQRWQHAGREVTRLTPRRAHQ
jgi:CHC2-type zinc finger protein/Toprim domain-containing protein